MNLLLDEVKKMTGNEYQRLASRTMKKGWSYERDAARDHALHGMVGEIGEIHSLYQKEYQGHGKPDVEHILKETGDLLWFVAEFLTSQGMSLDDCMETNIEKLKKRYPDGFDAEHSLNRADGDI